MSWHLENKLVAITSQLKTKKNKPNQTMASKNIQTAQSVSHTYGAQTLHTPESADSTPVFGQPCAPHCVSGRFAPSAPPVPARLQPDVQHHALHYWAGKMGADSCLQQGHFALFLGESDLKVSYPSRQRLHRLDVGFKRRFGIQRLLQLRLQGRGPFTRTHLTHTGLACTTLAASSIRDSTSSRLTATSVCSLKLVTRVLARCSCCETSATSASFSASTLSNTLTCSLSSEFSLFAACKSNIACWHCSSEVRSCALTAETSAACRFSAAASAAFRSLPCESAARERLLLLDRSTST